MEPTIEDFDEVPELLRCEACGEIYDSDEMEDAWFCIHCSDDADYDDAVKHACGCEVSYNPPLTRKEAKEYEDGECYDCWQANRLHDGS